MVKNIWQTTVKPRYPKGAVSSINTNFIHLHNPWVPAWWSAAFPGFGHILQGIYIRGFLLIIWEFIVNINSHLNTAIYYSFIGRFSDAKNVLDKRWALLYVGGYIYAIWDSYRISIDLNSLSRLSDLERLNMEPLKIDGISINYFDKRNPWLAIIWSLLVPGTAQFYSHRLLTGFFILGWWMVTMYFSHLLEAVHFTFTGNFLQAAAVTDPEWLLFMPSIYGFAIYDAYSNTVEYNKLYDIEQAQHLRDNYQSANFKMPL